MNRTRRLEDDVAIALELSSKLADRSFTTNGAAQVWQAIDPSFRRGASDNIYDHSLGPARSAKETSKTPVIDAPKPGFAAQQKVGESTVWCEVTDFAGDGVTRYVEFLEPKSVEAVAARRQRRLRKTLRKCALCNSSFESSSLKATASRQCVNQVSRGSFVNERLIATVSRNEVSTRLILKLI